MRHRKSGRTLSRTSAKRKAMFRSMVTSLIQHERIQTTDAKAKELRRFADKLITLARKGGYNAQRRAGRTIQDKDALFKLFNTLGPRYKDRDGGYTRVIKIGFRHGDAAPVSLVELVDSDIDAPMAASEGEEAEA